MDGPVRITPGQFDVLTAPLPAKMEASVRRHLGACYPEVIATAGEPQIRRLIDQAMRRADDYGYNTTRGYCHFVNFIMTAGADFDRVYRQPRAKQVRATLKDGAMDPEARLDRVYSLLDLGPEGAA